MKTCYALTAAALAGHAVAFPAAINDALAADPVKFAQLAKEKRVSGINPGFNAKTQRISTTGAYTWVAPGPTDQRGPCPGLNAFANHNYIPHNGIATIQQFIDATTSVVGMGADLAAFLAIYGAVFDGDLTKWSIGGPDARVGVPLLGTPLGLLGTPQGISGSHNKYEADVSPTRGDLYQYGNDYEVVLSQFTELYSLQAAIPNEQQNFDLGVQTSFRIKRFQQSIEQNPYFFNNFFSGVLVQPAAFTFQYRFMANHSAEQPAGYLTGQHLKDWFSVTGDYPNFKYTAGYERIPDNWYRRAFGDEYTIPFFQEDLLAMAVENPQFLDIGGNTDGVNTFTGLDVENITGGLYNTKNLADPATLSCFIYQMIIQQSPDILLPGIQLTQKALNLLAQAAAPFGQGGDFSCSKLSSIQNAQFRPAMMKYPGYAQLNQKTGKY